MARQVPVLCSLNAGEWSPLMYGRVDLARYPNSSRRSENFIPTVQGPSTRRGGTRFIEFQKDTSQRAWLASFRFTAAQAYLIEVGPGYFRFYTNRAQLLNDGVPVEVATPYTAQDLTTPDGTFGLNFEQVGDVIYIATAKRWPRKLTRITPTEWTLTEHLPRSGPLQDVNANKALRLTVSGRSGSVSIQANSALFTPLHVGMLIRVELEDISIPPWEPGKAVEAGALRRSDGKTYLATNANGTRVTGSKTPIHEEGTVLDGSGQTTDEPPKDVGIGWTYQDPGYGIGRIVSFVNATEVAVDVQPDMPFPTSLIGLGSNVWQLGAWGDAGEYPAHVDRWKNRLKYASDRSAWLSVPGDYDDFARDIQGEVRADAGITRQLDATDALAWIRSGEVVLMGTESTELVAQKQTYSEPVGPDNYDADRKSGYGSRHLRPEIVGLGLVAADKSGRRLRELRYSLETQSYEAADLTVEAEHITRSGVVDWAFQKQPHRVLWQALANGSLIGFTLERDQEVRAAHRHPTDGNVLAVEALPSPDGTRDDVWLLVERALSGGARRCIEIMDKGREHGEPLAESFFVDCGLTYRGPLTQTISNLGHLVGVEVAILADGAAHPRMTVPGTATIQLRYPASLVHVGLPMRALIEPMTATGSLASKAEAMPTVELLLYETVGGKAGPTESRLRPLSGRSPATPDGQPQPMVSDFVKVAIDGGHERRASVVIVQDEPLPMTVCGILPEVEKK